LLLALSLLGLTSVLSDEGGVKVRHTRHVNKGSVVERNRGEADFEKHLCNRGLSDNKNSKNKQCEYLGNIGHGLGQMNIVTSALEIEGRLLKSGDTLLDEIAQRCEGRIGDGGRQVLAGKLPWKRL